MKCSTDAGHSLFLFISRHALFWLVAGNAIGLWLSLLLLFPNLNVLAGEISYGRILPVHLNLQLYGWLSLPLVAWLFYLFPSRSSSFDSTSRGAIFTWTVTLGMAAFSWCLGQSSGKIFLEWRGFSRVAFAFTLLFLWSVLAARFWRAPRANALAFFTRAFTLVALLAVVPFWFWAASPTVYPAVNPDTSGPTAASLLGSTLTIVLLLLLTGSLFGNRSSFKSIVILCWIVFAVEVALFAVSEKGNRSHRSITQALLLGSLLVWIPLLFYYFRAFAFPLPGRPALRACLAWFGLLTLTGWLSFLPRILDVSKFTNALVAHSHLAMAGFATTFSLFLLIILLDRDGLSFAPSRITLLAWNTSTFVYTVLMWTAGSFEASDPAFTILPNGLRTTLYSLRAVCGVIMLLSSIAWWRLALTTGNAPQPEGLRQPVELALAQ